MSDLWEKALEAAEEARALMRADLPNGAISRAYYAVFTAARALLLSRLAVEEDQIRRHAAVLKLFSEHVIRPGLMPAEFGKELRNLFEDRADADYSTTRLSREEAQRAMAFMERFVQRSATLLGQATP